MDHPARLPSVSPTCQCPEPPGLPGRCVSHLRCSTARSDPIPLAQIALPQSSPPPPSPRPLEDPLHPLHPLPCIPGHPTQQPYFVTQGTLPAGQPRTGRGEHLALGGLDWTVSLCISLTPTQTSAFPFPGGTLKPKATLPHAGKVSKPTLCVPDLGPSSPAKPTQPLGGAQGTARTWPLEFAGTHHRGVQAGGIQKAAGPAPASGGCWHSGEQKRTSAGVLGMRGLGVLEAGLRSEGFQVASLSSKPPRAQSDPT